MNDDTRFERLFADGLHELSPVRAPDRLRTKVKAETGEVRPRPRWLAFIKEPPMRTNSRLAVGSPTARVASIVAATLLATLLVVAAGIAGAQIFAADGPIIVDGSGGGDYTTIGEAVAVAEDGDEILVRPGIYVEAVVIDKDITLTSEGDVEDIVVMAPEDGPTAPLWEGTINADPYALLLSETNATVSGLTFSGQGAEVILDGGTPSLTDSVFMGVGRAFDGSNLSPNASSVVVTGGASPLVARNMIRDGGPIGVFGGSNPTIKANTLTGGPHIFLYVHGDGVVIEDNTIDGTLRWAIGSFRRGGRADITRNTITNPGANGINLTDGTADIVGNAISGATAAGITTGLELVNVVDNQLADNKIGVLFSAGEGEVSGNTVRGGDIGFALSTNVRVSGNDVEGASGPGISITFGAPMLRENRSCGNGTDLLIADRAQPDVDESNEICEAEPAA